MCVPEMAAPVLSFIFATVGVLVRAGEQRIVIEVVFFRLTPVRCPRI